MIFCPPRIYPRQDGEASSEIGIGGEPRDSSPPTPPYVRVRIRRFGGLSGHLIPQEG